MVEIKNESLGKPGEPGEPGEVATSELGGTGGRGGTGGEGGKGYDRRTFMRDLDVRGALALMSLVGLLTVIFIQLVQGSGSPTSIRVPAELAGTVGAIVGFYFGGRGDQNGNGKH